MSDEISKRYYSIGEVAQLFGLNASVLRHWETEFDHIRPKKNHKGERQYTQKDIDKIRLIYHLVRDKGYTLTGAKEYIKAKTQEDAEKENLIAALEKMKLFLTDLRDNLDKKNG